MKNMTCRQLGVLVTSSTGARAPTRVIKAQDCHLEEAHKAQDATHQAAREAMKGRWRRPRQAMDWYRGTKKAFAQAPDS